MKTSIDQLKLLIEILGEEWKSQLDSYLKNENVELTQKSKAVIEDFFQCCMEEIKENNVSNLQKVEKKIDNDLLYKNLKDHLDRLLWVFYAFSPLRVLGVTDLKRAGEILKQIFNLTILRYNPNILRDYEKYGFDNGNSFVDFLNAQDSLCTCMIEKNMHRDVMEDFIYVQTRVSKELCKQLADMVDHNFNELRLNYIMEKLNALQVQEKRTYEMA